MLAGQAGTTSDRGKQELIGHVYSGGYPSGCLLTEQTVLLSDRLRNNSDLNIRTHMPFRLALKHRMLYPFGSGGSSRYQVIYIGTIEDYKHYSVLALDE